MSHTNQVFIFCDSSDPLTLARGIHAFHAVQFHPIEPLFVVTANSRDGVALWDIRKSGG